MEAPFIGLQMTVPSEWIDVNGHMNATHYGLVVYDAHFNFTRALGLGDEYVEATDCGKAVLESHLIYEREVSAGDELEIRSWLLAVDSKRLHFFHEVYNVTTGVRAAAAEQVDIHLDLAKRRSAPLPEPLLESLRAVVRTHLSQPMPEGVASRLRPPTNDWLEQA